VKQAFDGVFKKVNAALGKQKAVSYQVKRIANDQLAEAFKVKQMLNSRPTLIKSVEGVERELKKR